MARALLWNSSMMTSPSIRSARTGNSSRTQVQKDGKSESRRPGTAATVEPDWSASTLTQEAERLARARLTQHVAAQRPHSRLAHLRDVLRMALGRDDEEDYECAKG
jgi:hypothetical protein